MLRVYWPRAPSAHTFSESSYLETSLDSMRATGANGWEAGVGGARGQPHLIGLVADPAAKGLPSNVGHHVPLQHGWGAEDLPTRGAGVVLLGVHLVDVLPVVLQCGEAHPAFLAIVRIFYVCFQAGHGGRGRGRQEIAAVSDTPHLTQQDGRLFRLLMGQSPRTPSQCGNNLALLCAQGGRAPPSLRTHRLHGIRPLTSTPRLLSHMSTSALLYQE